MAGFDLGSIPDGRTKEGRAMRQAAGSNAPKADDSTEIGRAHV